MELNITMNLNGDAFVDDPELETAQILRKVAAQIERFDSVNLHKFHTVIRDSNGNRIGEAVVTGV